jgi:light-harvesting complex I chlorophyll a/b binding protein 1
MKTKELNNGRLAMIAIAGFVAQEVADGGQVEIFEHWFSNVEKELGIEAVEIEQDLGL